MVSAAASSALSMLARLTASVFTMSPAAEIMTARAVAPVASCCQALLKAAAADPFQPASPTIWLTFLSRAVATSLSLGTYPYRVPAYADRPWMSPPTQLWANGASADGDFAPAPTASPLS